MESSSQVDFVVLGAGVAGLRAAVDLARHGEVLVATKEAVGESNTHYAQGGIAVALGGPQDVALHLEDTLRAGAGLVRPEAARVLVEEGPRRVAELIEWGANFDRENGQLVRTREGAHSLRRILHANGDATGAEISRSLAVFARAHRRIHFAEWTRAERLLLAGGRVAGLDLVHEGASADESFRVETRAVLIATGGAGQVYSDTTNPSVATGDGIALAASAGATLADMEFYQFHPTAFFHPGAPRFLLSEALRGEGAWLRNAAGERFMEALHPMAELAPRDVVARAIARQAIAPDGGSLPVYLDMRHVRGLDLRHRFPGISEFLSRYGLELARDLIPVRPAAHYLMGGILTDLDGRTTLPGLYAAGEAASTGVHGANRLASNSLLEGLVFGARAAQAILDDAPAGGEATHAIDLPPLAEKPLSADEQAQVADLAAQIRALTWSHAGLLRSGSGLEQGQRTLEPIAARLDQLAAQGKGSRLLAEARSMALVAAAILGAALARRESRGAHFRSDFPQLDDARFLRHSLLTRSTLRFE